MIELLIALKWPLIILQGILSTVLIILVLLQPGKGDDLGSAFSAGGGSNTILGTGGASKFLVRGTVIFVTLFMLNSIVLAVLFKKVSESSVTTNVSEPLVPPPAKKAPGANDDSNSAAEPAANALVPAPAAAASTPAPAAKKMVPTPRPSPSTPPPKPKTAPTP